MNAQRWENQTMLNVGIIGLEKKMRQTYLPIFRELPHVKWYIYSRNKAILDEQLQLLNKAIPCDTIEDLLTFHIQAAFVFVKTNAHYEVAKQLLTRGIPVYIEFPVFNDASKVAELYRLAKQHQTFIMPASVHRFSPFVQEIKKMKDKKKIRVEAVEQTEFVDTRDRIYHHFLPLLDTALYLMDDEILKGSFRYKKRQRVIEQCSVYLENMSETVSVELNVSTHADRRIVEVQSESAIMTWNQRELIIQQGEDTIVDKPKRLDTPLYYLGYESAIHTFIEAVQQQTVPITPYSCMVSHSICERIASAVASEGFLSFEMEQDFK